MIPVPFRRMVGKKGKGVDESPKVGKNRGCEKDISLRGGINDSKVRTWRTR